MELIKNIELFSHKIYIIIIKSIFFMAMRFNFIPMLSKHNWLSNRNTTPRLIVVVVFPPPSCRHSGFTLPFLKLANQVNVLLYLCQTPDNIPMS